MSWPQLDDFRAAIQNPGICFADADLKAGRVICDGLGLPRVSSGNFACVYELDSGGRRWAVRIFNRQVIDHQRRYGLISSHLQAVLPPYMAYFQYLSSGIMVRGQWLPIVKMEWVEGLSLTRWVRQNLSRPDLIRLLAARWRAMVGGLYGLGVAHGDLQQGNILITPFGEIRLVDYDGMFIPAMQGERAPELGHPNWNHPQRSADTFGTYLDQFAGLVGYVSLLAIAVEPKLLARYCNDDNLILKQADFCDPHSSACFGDLSRSQEPAVKSLSAELARWCQSAVGLTTLEEVAGGVRVSAASASSGAAPVPSTGVPSWIGGYGARPMPPSPAGAGGQPPAPAPGPRSSTPQPVSLAKPRSAAKTGVKPKLSLVLALVVAVLLILVSGQWIWRKLVTKPREAVGIEEGGVTGKPEESRAEKVKKEPEEKELPAVVKDSVLGTELVPVKGGEFEMGNNFGDGESDELPVHKVYVSDFYLGKYEVTFEEYDRFCEEDGREKPGDSSGWGRGKRPVINVSWDDADAFCRWLSKKTGKRYRLPTEAEWEYAARAGGKKIKYPWGNDAPDKNLCNFDSSQTVPVGQYPPNALGLNDMAGNALGLYDMAGNVWEWCSDWYGSDYYKESDGVRNPGGPSGGSDRVKRGGGWDGDPRYLRCSYRSYVAPSYRNVDLGFRLLREP